MLTTYTGKFFDYNNFTKDDINVKDIIHALTMINRFVGHSSRSYSVAEHSLNCLVMAEKLKYTTRERLLVFIHDFAEAYIGDCPTPLKKLLPQYQEIEKRVENAILDYLRIFEVTDEEKELVRKIDYTMLVIEMRDLTLHNHYDLIRDNIYSEFLEDIDFKLTKNDKPTENELRYILKIAFNQLINDYHKYKR